MPYNVRVFAENGAGNGSFCVITDFGNEASKLNCCSTLAILIIISLSFSLSLSISLSLSLSPSVPLTAPEANLARSINIARSDDGTAAHLSWDVRPLDQIKGHASFVIEYTQQSGTAKRQIDCPGSGCRVPYEQGEVTVQGLNPNLPVTFDITAVNEDREEAMAVRLIAKRWWS